MVLAGLFVLKDKSLPGAASMGPIHSIQGSNIFAGYF